MELFLDQLNKAGPWLTVAGITLAVLVAIVKVVILDHSLVPWELLQNERKRTDTALAAGAESVAALHRVTDALQDMKRVVESLQRDVAESRRDLDDYFRRSPPPGRR